MITVNPILSQILRGASVESYHRGAFCVSDAQGNISQASGDVKRNIFPRSAIKAFQCVPVIETGAADRFGFSPEEIALCCASHSGEAEHVRVAAAMLRKIGIDETAYECGNHWPERMADKIVLARANQQPRAIHNNCSGKHAGMLAVAKQLLAPFQGYTLVTHPVQQAVARVLDRYCDADTAHAPKGIDGCSVPTWALPLENLARGFAKLFVESNATGQRIAQAVGSNPFMIAGTKKFDTSIMQALPRLFIKVGAEGVYCGAIPHAALGFALKIDDGAVRGAEVAIAKLLADLDCWTVEEKAILAGFTHVTLSNWRSLEVGQARARAADGQLTVEKLL
jgi:L-asparaginase II